MQQEACLLGMYRSAHPLRATRRPASAGTAWACPDSRSAAPQLACLARGFLLSGTHRFLRRTPLGVLSSRAAAGPRIGDRLSTLLPLARAARDTGLGVLAADLLRASLCPLRRRLIAPPRSFGSRLRHPVPSLTEFDASLRSRRERRRHNGPFRPFPQRGLADEVSPDPLDLDGARPARAGGSRRDGEPLDAIVMELRTPRLGGIRRPTAHPGGVVHHGEGRLMIGRAIGRAAR